MQKVHSRSACQYEDLIYDAYMQELNAVVLYAVIFVLGWFVLASVLLTPVLVRETNGWWEGLDMMMLFVLSTDGQILQSVLIFIDLHGSIAAERLN